MLDAIESSTLEISTLASKSFASIMDEGLGEGPVVSPTKEIVSTARNLGVSSYSRIEGKFIGLLN